MKRKVLVIVIAPLAATVVSGKSSKMVVSWRNPNSQTKQFHRVLALGF